MGIRVKIQDLIMSEREELSDLVTNTINHVFNDGNVYTIGSLSHDLREVCGKYNPRTTPRQHIKHGRYVGMFEERDRIRTEIIKYINDNYTPGETFYGEEIAKEFSLKSKQSGGYLRNLFIIEWERGIGKTVRIWHVKKMERDELSDIALEYMGQNDHVSAKLLVEQGYIHKRYMKQVEHILRQESKKHKDWISGRTPYGLVYTNTGNK